MWFNVRVLVGVGTGLGTGFGVFKMREHCAENMAEMPFSLAVPPKEEITRLHSCPYLSWDHNWDMRATLKRDKNGNLTVDESKNAKYRRYLILINDCHHVNDTGEDAPSMTALGETQARTLAHFLVNWLSWEEWLSKTSIFHSPLTRSRELAKIISKEMATVPVTELDLLEEGVPTSRPEQTSKEETVEIVLAHPNIIRYFVCRALQLPPEAFSRFFLNHASMTRIEIFGGGVVNVVSVGDTGYLTPEKFTIGEIDAVPPVL